MSIFKKVMTAIRGGVNEAGEAIVDANGVRIFEQEIRDAEGHIAKAKNDLTGVMANKMQAERESTRLAKEIAEHENYAGQALEKSDETLALQVAEKIADLEAQKAESDANVASFDKSVVRLKELVKKSERQIGEYKRQISMAKTTENVQKATSAISDNFSSSNSKLLNAKDSLERIKAKQQQFDDKLAAAEELEAEGSDASLKSQLAAAGIGEQSSNANSVLERLKAKQNK